MSKTCHYITLAFGKNQNRFKKWLQKRAMPLFCMFMVTNLYHSYLNPLHYVFTVLKLLKLQIFILFLYINSVTTQMFLFYIYLFYIDAILFYIYLLIRVNNWLRPSFIYLGKKGITRLVPGYGCYLQSQITTVVNIKYSLMYTRVKVNLFFVRFYGYIILHCIFLLK